ncbi:MAG: hypothetical protein ABI589_11910 [Burkholderiales bacterium]
MLKPRTLKLLMLLLAGYGLAVIPAAVWPAYLDSPAGVLVAIPLLSVYLLHGAGVPGLLEHNGLCGSGWCSPTLLGWLLAAVLWLGIAWLIAWGIAALTHRPVAR